ncbi:glycosyltransferase family 2 protein [Desulforhopalus sp. IMCC35007]|uniref:glycosyltransferase n=1 Tax=Desulforhopalus sp. IMCC35007 TaxID=2569543 RepID=UPI00145F10E4|nr:glycosyltransferase [Desulforhopalus sp. IMCC35007]
MTVQPIVSIVVPAKNEELYISRCLQGVLESTYRSDSIEIVVVDNGSIDQTPHIAASLDAKVLTRNNGSIASMRNYGAQMASGEILGFVDADCIVHPDWLAKGVSHLMTDESIYAVGAPESAPVVGATWVETTWSGLKHGAPPANGLLLSTWCASGALLIRKADFLKIGGFNEQLTTCEDADLGSRLSKFGAIVIDFSVPFQHLRGSKTLIELFRREMWRGRDNITGFISHGMSLQEFPSVVVPLLFFFCLVGGIFSYMVNIWFQNDILSFIYLISLSSITLLPLMMMVKKMVFGSSIVNVFRNYIVCFVYLLARGCGSTFSAKRV